MAYVEGRAPGITLPPFAERARATAAVVRSRFVRERAPLAIASAPPVEHPIYDPTLERFQASAARLWSNIAEKKKLIQNGDPKHQDIKTALVIGGGGMAGVVTAGMLEELRDRDLINGFDVVVGTSAGSVNAACVLGSKTEAGVHTYTTQFANRQFIKHGLWWPRGMDLSRLSTFLRGSDGIDPEKIRNREAGPELQIGVADQNGKSILLKATDLTDDEIHDALLASCAAPYVYNQQVEIGGKTYTDGFVPGFPLAALTEQGYDNVLVLMNFPVDHVVGGRDYSAGERLWIRSHMRRYPPAVTEATINGPEVILSSLAPLLDTTANFSLVAPETMQADVVTIDQEKLNRAGEEGRRALRKQLNLASSHLAA